jgi:predicted Zn-dependent protease
VSQHLARRVETLERRAAPATAAGPGAGGAAAAAPPDRAVARIAAEHPDACPTVFVMTLGRGQPEPSAAAGSA